MPIRSALEFRTRRRRARIGVVVLVVAATVSGLGGGKAGAADLSGCQGTASSTDGSGQPLDTASGPGEGGTSADPLHVRSDGRVTYDGTSQDVLKNGRWRVEVGVPLVPDISGRVTNAEGLQTWSGNEDVDKRLPFPVRGLFRVKFTISAPAATPCTGSVWIRMDGNPLPTPLGAASVVLTVVGLWGLVRDIGNGTRRFGGRGEGAAA